jgi:hypothetical protein
MTDSEILLAAADHIATAGLHKGELWPGRTSDKFDYTPGDPCDMLGAIAIVTGDTVCVAGVLHILFQLDTFFQEDNLAWQDDPERTVDEVIFRLQHAAREWT